MTDRFPMLAAAMRALYDRLQDHPVIYARARGALSPHPLPPGDLAVLDVLERPNRAALLERANDLGPVFKGIAWGRLCVCVVGLDRCRRLTREHGHAMRTQTIELDHLIPKGFVGAMKGDDHRHYRKSTHRALNASAEGADDSVLDAIAVTVLRDYAARAGEHGNAPVAYSAAMSAIATQMLTWLFYGAEPGTAVHERFLAHFRALGPHGLVWNPQQRQEVAFRAFRDDLIAEVAAMRAGRGVLRSTGLLSHMVAQETVDETLIGNLIYHGEMGRSDIKNLFRWLSRHVADEPAVLDRIAAEDPGSAGERSLAEAFVLETLRTDQSERLMREAERDIVFDGFLIPRHTTIRLCMWESHHEESAFADPHRFDPARFLGEMPGRDRYAPFGVDQHQCPMGGVVVRLGTVFVRVLARGHRLTRLGEGPPVRGGYHWEPGPQFAVQLRPRS